MKVFPSLSPDLTEWALRQPVYFIATAPTHGRHVNLSPKGLPSTTLSVLGPNRIGYVDRTGSGCETIAHLYENGRATIMFMSLGPAPRILRLYCSRADVVEWTEGGRFDGALASLGLPRPASPRAVVLLDVFKVTTSCGYGVPRVRRGLYAKGRRAGGEEEGGGDDDDDDEGAEPGAELAVFEDRPTLDHWAAKTEKAGATAEYQAAKNAYSLDGLPGLRAARRARGRWVWAGDLAARIAAQREGVAVGFVLATLAWAVLVMLVGGVPGFPAVARSEGLFPGRAT